LVEIPAPAREAAWSCIALTLSARRCVGQAEAPRRGVVSRLANPSW